MPRQQQTQKALRDDLGGKPQPDRPVGLFSREARQAAYFSSASISSAFSSRTACILATQPSGSLAMGSRSYCRQDSSRGTYVRAPLRPPTRDAGTQLGGLLCNPLHLLQTLIIANYLDMNLSIILRMRRASSYSFPRYSSSMGL